MVATTRGLVRSVAIRESPKRSKVNAEKKAMLEWSQDREAAYVNARGMDARTALLAAAERLGIATGPELATPLFDDVRSMLLARWRNGWLAVDPR